LGNYDGINFDLSIALFSQDNTSRGRKRRILRGILMAGSNHGGFGGRFWIFILVNAFEFCHCKVYTAEWGTILRI